MSPASVPVELSLVVFQAAVTLAIAGLFLVLAATYRKRYFGIWAGAWSVYALRLGIIALFLATFNRIWLYWHQVATGWTALLLLWAALVFSRQLPWNRRYYPVFLIPVLWAYVAIYRIESFLWAAIPSVLFLSLATLGTGVIFLQYWRRAASKGAVVLAAAFLLWGVHHLDYTVLRARGAWVPYGYYLDILFELAVGGGMLLLVLEDQHRGMAALASLSEDLQRSLRPADVVAAVLERPLALPPVVGCALYREDGAGTLTFRGGSGVCALWGETTLAAAAPSRADTAPILAAPRAGVPQVVHYWPRGADSGAGPIASHPYAAFLPVFMGERAAGTFVIVARARDPFASLDRGFLRALGHQIGAALQHAELYAALEARSADLRRASASLLRAAESERQRIARELHDETGQMVTAIKLELADLERTLAGTGRGADAVERAIHLASRALESIRATARGLRPTALDDLGLVPAMRTLAEEFAGRTGIAVDLKTAPLPAPPPAPEVEVALYRVLQEALTNVARHAAATRVEAVLGTDGGELVLVVQDDGKGFDASRAGTPTTGGAGLAGMQERVVGVGGRLTVTSAPGRGVRLEARLPLGESDA